jgi:hypothetical protein
LALGEVYQHLDNEKKCAAVLRTESGSSEPRVREEFIRILRTLWNSHNREEEKKCAAAL